MIGNIPRELDDAGTGPAPERFKSYHEVISLCSQMINDDRQRAIWRAEIDKLWGGNPTYSMAMLRAANQSWRARVNYRELEGIVSSEQTLDYDLESQVDTVIDIDLDFGKGQDQRDWEESIERNFTWMYLQKWDDRNFHVPFRIFQKLLHGMGTQVWPQLGNWRPQTPRAGMVLFPDDSPLNFHEEGDYFMLRDYQPAHVMYRYIQDEKAAHATGWHPDRVWKALATSGRSNGTNNYESNPEKLALMMRNGDLGMSSRQGGIWIDHMFVREIETGKISHYIVPENGDSGGYLFEKRNRFDDWPMVMFPYDIGNGTIQSVRGLGARTKDFFELSNRIKNSMADQVNISAYPQFKQTQPDIDPDKLRLMRVGAMSISPFGLEPNIMQFPPLGNGPLALSQELRQTMLQNNRGGMGSEDVEARDRQSATEYTARSMNISKLNNGSVSFQRANLRRSYERMLRMALIPSASKSSWSVMAKAFRDRCLRDGVPEEAFSKIVEVRAVTNRGKGSAAAQLQSLMMLMNTVYPATTEDRKIAIERDIVAATFGYGDVDRYARSVKDGEMPDNDESFAVSENNGLVQGGEALAVPRQDHIEHLQIHLGKGAELAAAVQQGQMNPQQAYAGIHAIGEHCGGSDQKPGHLFYLQQNPLAKAQFQQFYAQWKALSQIADQLLKQIQREAQQPDPEEQISDNLKIGMAKVQADQQVKSAKAQGDMQLKWRKQAVTERLNAQKVQSGNLLATAKTVSEIRHSRTKTVSDIQLSTADTVASIAQNAAKRKASTNGSAA